MRFIKKNLKIWVIGLLLMGVSSGFGAASRAVMEEEAAAAAGQGPVVAVAHVAPGDDQPSRREESEEAVPSGTQAQGGNPFVHINRLTLAEFQERYKFTPGQVTFLDLPPNVILNILSFCAGAPEIADHAIPALRVPELLTLRSCCRYLRYSLSAIDRMPGGSKLIKTMFNQLLRRGFIEIPLVVAEQVEFFDFRELEFAFCTIPREQKGKIISALLNQCSKLGAMVLNGVHVVDELVLSIAKGLSNNKTLRELTFDTPECSLKTRDSIRAVAKILKNNSTLKVLTVNCGVKFYHFDMGVFTKKRLDIALNTLNLNGVGINDAEVELLVKALDGNKKLTALGLKRNNITASGVRILAETLPNTVVQVLDLEENRIANLEASCLSSIIKSSNDGVHNSLTELNLSKNKITDSGAEYLIRALKEKNSLKVLGLCGNSFSQEVAIKLLENSHLRVLDLRANTLGDNFALAVAGILENPTTSLEKLDLSNNHIGSGAKQLASALSRNTKLQILNLGNNYIGDLSPEEKLGEGSASKVFSEALKKNKTLQKLDLSNNSLNGSDIAELLGALEQNKGLRKLNLGYNRRNNGDDFSQPFNIDALGENKTLEMLDLADNMIGDEEVLALINVLKKNKILRSLDLGFNRITNRGAQALADFLKFNSTLKRLNLQGNEEINTDGYKAFISVLSTNKCLEILNLFCATSDEKTRDMFETLKEQKPTLKIFLR